MLQVLGSPQLVHGPVAAMFEREFAASLSADAFATSVSSCTAGLHLAYLHLGIGPGDEVIAPAQTHVATAHAVEITGARPVFVDCRRETGNIDPALLANAVTARTRAICVVHYLGLPVEMQPVLELARKYALFVVEDCAHALGASLDGVAVALLGDIGSFSFYPAKHITTGEGGMVVSKHKDVVSSIEHIKAFGYDRTLLERATPGTYDISRLGLNYRMNEIAAAIGRQQLLKVATFAKKRAENARVLRELLASIPEVEVLAAGNDRAVHANCCLVVVLNDRTCAHRARIVTELRSRRIGTSVYFPVPLPLSRYYREKYGGEPAHFPNAVRISNQSIALPVGPHLRPDHMELIAAELKEAIVRSTA